MRLARTQTQCPPRFPPGASRTRVLSHEPLKQFRRANGLAFGARKLHDTPAARTPVHDPRFVPDIRHLTKFEQGRYLPYDDWRSLLPPADTRTQQDSPIPDSPPAPLRHRSSGYGLPPSARPLT